MSGQVAFDARALTDPIDAADFAAFRRSSEAPSVALRYFFGMLTALFAAVLGFAMALNLATLVTADGMWIVGAAFLGALLVLGGVSFGILRSIRALQERAYRLLWFARSNAMQFRAASEAPPLPGMIFNLGRARRAENVLRGSEPRLVEFGDYQYTTGSGKNSTTHRWQYIALHMHNALPNIVLDATFNNALGTNLPITFGRDQRLSLEGDFDRHFALYCPAGYERDALYLFTPDVMANFLDTMGAFDVEIVDDWVFLYSRTGARSSLRPDVWAWRFRAVQALLSKISQWERWRDDRLAELPAARPGAFAAPAPHGFAGAHASAVVPPLPPVPGSVPRGVAPQGRRLRRGIPWASIAVVGAIALFWILNNVARFAFN